MTFFPKSASFAGDTSVGDEMHLLAKRLFPICRSITGDGFRQSLALLSEHIPLTIHEVPSGTRVLDWVVPQEWNIRDAFIADEQGRRVVDFRENNLHVVGYSTPVDMELSLEQLQPHLHSIPDQPTAIPYVTSYYSRRWGFCLSHEQRSRLRDRKYRIRIDSELRDGSLTYGELIVRGESDREIFLSSYLCHPSMANNELSGPCVITFLAKWIASSPRRHTFRIVIIPETIGSVTYLSRHLQEMKARTVAGFNVTCVGDERVYSFMPSRNGGTLSDKVALNVLRFRQPDFIKHSYLVCGSDERQYCSPGVDLPVVSIMRSRYGTYPEYHTSLDDLSLVTPAGLQGSYEVLKECISALEVNHRYRLTVLAQPQLGRRGMYPSLSSLGSGDPVLPLLNLIAYADGTNDLIDISDRIGVPVSDLVPIARKLVAADLLAVVTD